MTGLKVSRRSDVAPFLALDMLKAANERASCGDDVLHMEIGEPSARPPAAAIAAAERAMREGRTGYTESLGIAELRERIAKDYASRHGIAVDPGRVIITTGSSAAFVLAFLAAFDSGDRVAITEPGYPAYPKLLSALGIEPVVIAAGAEHGFKLTPELLDRTIRTQGPVHGIMIASPANPTGTMLSRAELSALVDYCRDAGIRLLSDEIYHGITFSGPGTTALGLWDEAVVINSFSKYYCLTGWRIGWMITPEAMVRPIEKTAQNFYISVPTISQYAALAAMDCNAELDRHVAAYAKNRQHLLDVFGEIGLGRRAPADGAFYLYADVSDFTDDSLAFCKTMLDETGIAATPGRDFDAELGHHFVRFSFAGGEEMIREAGRRLGPWLEARRRAA